MSFQKINICKFHYISIFFLLIFFTFFYLPSKMPMKVWFIRKILYICFDHVEINPKLWYIGTYIYTKGVGQTNTNIFIIWICLHEKCSFNLKPKWSNILQCLLFTFHIFLFFLLFHLMSLFVFLIWLRHIFGQQVYFILINQCTFKPFNMFLKNSQIIKCLNIKPIQ